MKTRPYRNRSLAAVVAAALVSTLLAAAVVESFNPALLRHAAQSRRA